MNTGNSYLRRAEKKNRGSVIRTYKRSRCSTSEREEIGDAFYHQFPKTHPRLLPSLTTSCSLSDTEIFSAIARSTWTLSPDHLQPLFTSTVLNHVTLPGCRKMFSTVNILCQVLIVAMVLTFPALGMGSVISGNAFFTKQSVLCSVELPHNCSCYNWSIDHFQPGPILQGVDYDTTNNVVYCSGVKSFPSVLPSDSQVLILDQSNLMILTNPFSNRNDSADHFNVRLLSMQSNGIRHVDSNIFGQFASIKSLLLKHNFISNMTWTVGLRSNPLLYLDLSFNFISTISSNDFAGLKHLKWLDLSYNRIGSIEMCAFCLLPDLQHLDLSSNFITTENMQVNSFVGLSKLSFLSLADNPLLRVPNFNFMGLEKTSVTNLDLHGLCSLKELTPGVLHGFKNLQLLNLSHCSLETMQLGWLNGGPDQSLETLDLSFNYFSKIEANFFVAADNQKNMHHESYLHQPEVDKLPYIISSRVGTTSSHLSHINYEYLLQSRGEAKLYRPLARLTWLSISENYRLRHIADNAFKFLPALRYLFLQKCSINRLKLASTTHQFKSEAIHLSLPELKYLWIYGNPLYCDCHVRAVVNQIPLSTPPFNNNCTSISDKGSKRDKYLYVDAEKYVYNGRCHEIVVTKSSNCEGIPLKDVSTSFLSCPDEPISMLIVAIIGPLTFAASILLVLLCGFLTVFLGRLRRYKSGLYPLMNYQRGNKSVEVSPPTINANRNNKGSNFNGNCRSVSPMLTQRLRYNTNMVLGGMSRTGSDASLRLNRLTTSQRSRSPSPSPSRKFKRSKKPLKNRSPASGCSSADIKLCDLDHRGGAQSSLVFSSSYKTKTADSERPSNALHFTPSIPKRQQSLKSQTTEEICPDLAYIDDDAGITSVRESEFLLGIKSQGAETKE